MSVKIKVLCLILSVSMVFGLGACNFDINKLLSDGSGGKNQEQQENNGGQNGEEEQQENNGGQNGEEEPQENNGGQNGEEEQQENNGGQNGEEEQQENNGGQNGEEEPQENNGGQNGEEEPQENNGGQNGEEEPQENNGGQNGEEEQQENNGGQNGEEEQQENNGGQNGEEEPPENNGGQKDEYEYVSLDYCRIQTEYLQVIEPINQAALYIIKDLIDTGKMTNPIGFNPRLTGIRFCYGTDIHLYIDGDEPFEDGTKSEFKRACAIVIIENIGGHYSSQYETVRAFINKDRLTMGKTDYLTQTKPYAVAAAKAITEAYDGCNKDNLTVRVSPRGENESIFITEETKEEYDYLKSFINNYIINKNFEMPPSAATVPLCAGGQIEISFSGYLGAINMITLGYYFGNSKVTLGFNLTDKSILTDELLKYFAGVYAWGYSTSFDSLPQNCEYMSFFETLAGALPKNASVFYSSFGQYYGEETIINLIECGLV